MMSNPEQKKERNITQSNLEFGCLRENERKIIIIGFWNCKCSENCSLLIAHLDFIHSSSLAKISHFNPFRPAKIYQQFGEL